MRSQPRTFDRSLKYPVKKDAEGKRLCRWDQKPIPKYRKAYCSDECQIEVDVRTSASRLRFHVKQRDNGVCAECRCDTEKLKRVIEHAGRSFSNTEHYGRPIRGRALVHAWYCRDVWPIFAVMGFNHTPTLWEADHVKELSNGGDGGLDNVQTLCVPCHKAKTKRMHVERAQARRDAKRALLDQPTGLSLF